MIAKVGSIHRLTSTVASAFSTSRLLPDGLESCATRASDRLYPCSWLRTNYDARDERENGIEQETQPTSGYLLVY